MGGQQRGNGDSKMKHTAVTLKMFLDSSENV